MIRVSLLTALICRCTARSTTNHTDRPKPCADHKGTAQVLQRHRVRLDKVAQKYPHALRYDVAKTEAMIQVLTMHDIEVGKAVTRNPAVLSMAPETLHMRLEALEGLVGERMPHVVASSPTLLGLLPYTLETKMNLLVSLGLNANLILRRSPRIFTHSEQSMRQHVLFFKDMGLDTVRIINAKPDALNLRIERTLRPLIDYITIEMGRSLDDINKCPRCFSTSLEQRLKPRHEYLKLHGKRQDYSLRVICGFTDERFVTLTDQTPDRYCLWLAARNQ